MFVPALDSDVGSTLNILKGNGEFVVRVPVGFDPECGNVFSLLVAISPLAGYADIPGYELIFGIVEAAVDGSDLNVSWDGAETKHFLADRRNRQAIRGILHVAVATLIDEAKPKLISMTTHTADLPERALGKFNELCAVFAAKGFKADKADTWHGRHMWMMFREET